MVSTMAARSWTHCASCAVACRATANMDKNSSKIFMIMRSALQKSKASSAVPDGSKNDARQTLRRTAALMKTTVVGAATEPAPALALWLASAAEASTRAYAQGWQPAVAD